MKICLGNFGRKWGSGCNMN